MDYQEYKEDFLNTLRADSAHSGTDTEEEFLNYTLGLLEDFDEIDSPEMTGMGDKKGKGGRLMRADGYCFDESEHSLIPESVKLSKQQSAAPVPKRYSPRHCFC